MERCICQVLESAHRYRLKLLSYLSPGFARGAFCNGRDIYFAMKHFYECTDLRLWRCIKGPSSIVLGFMVVDKITKHLLGFTQSKYSPWPSLYTSPARVGEN